MYEDGLYQVVVDFVEVHLGEGLDTRGGADPTVPRDDLLRADMLVFLTSLGLFHLRKMSNNGSLCVQNQRAPDWKK